MKMVNSTIKRIINETIAEFVQEHENDLNRYIPKKAFRAIDKLNADLLSLKEYTGEEYPVLLDTSTGTETFCLILSDIQFVNGALTWKQQWSNEKPSVEEWNLVREYEDGTIEFDEYSFREQLSELKKGIKKARKYFDEYDPEMDDNEEKRNSFLSEM